MKTGEIFPTNIVPVVADRPRLMKWGFAKYEGSGVIINARSETAAEKATFRGPMQAGRCLIPATNYFEWEKRDGNKIKYAIRVEGDPVLYMAGIYKVEREGELPVFAILTREPADRIRFIHDRMPVILSKAGQEAWMSGDKNVARIFGLTKNDVVYEPVEAQQEQVTMF